jgi:hypothetical protein
MSDTRGLEGPFDRDDAHDAQEDQRPGEGEELGQGRARFERPGGPGQDGMRATEGGMTPAPESPAEAPDHDPVVEERRRHVVAAHGGDGTAPQVEGGDARSGDDLGEGVEPGPQAVDEGPVDGPGLRG